MIDIANMAGFFLGIRRQRRLALQHFHPAQAARALAHTRRLDARVGPATGVKQRCARLDVNDMARRYKRDEGHACR